MNTAPLRSSAVVLAIFLAACTSTKPAQEPLARTADELVQEVIDLTMSEAQIRRGMAVGMGLAGQDMPPALVEGMTGFMEEHLDIPGLQAEMKALYLSLFTVEELSELARFHGSTTGRKLIANQTLIVGASTKHFQQLMVDHRAEFMQMVQNAMQPPQK